MREGIDKSRMLILCCRPDRVREPGSAIGLRPSLEIQRGLENRRFGLVASFDGPAFNS